MRHLLARAAIAITRARVTLAHVLMPHPETERIAALAAKMEAAVDATPYFRRYGGAEGAAAFEIQRGEVKARVSVFYLTQNRRMMLFGYGASYEEATEALLSSLAVYAKLAPRPAC